MKNKSIVLPLILLSSLALLVGGCSVPQFGQVMTLEPELNGNLDLTTAAVSPVAPPDTTIALTTAVPVQPAPSTPAVSTPPYTPPPATSVPVPPVITEEKPTMNIILGTFVPGLLTVAQNTEVVFGDIDHYNYRIFSPGIFDTDLLSEGIFVYIFSEPGTYNIWIDSVQKGETLEGVIIVTD